MIKENELVNQKCYQILQNNSETQLLLGATPLQQQHAYQLINVKGHIYRRYRHTDSQSQLAYLLPIADWRRQTSQPVASCFYIKIHSPSINSKMVQYSLFTEHMELLLKDMSKLITCQALYILVRGLKGYKQLLQKFKQITVNGQTVGFNSVGECIVWLNRCLDKNYPQYHAISDEVEVTTALIGILKEKGEKTCQKILDKIHQYTTKNKSTIPQTLAYIDTILHINTIKVPDNLKYFLKHFKIIKHAQDIKGQPTTRKPQKHNTEHLSVPKFANTQKSIIDFKSPKLVRGKEVMEKHIKNVKNYMKRSTQQKGLFSSKVSQNSGHSLNAQKIRKMQMDSRFCSSNQVQSKNSNSRSNSHEWQKGIRVANKIQHPSSSKSLQKNSLPAENQFKFHIHIKNSMTPTASSLIDGNQIRSSKTLSGLAVGGSRQKVHTSFISNQEMNKVVQEEQEYENSPEKCNQKSLLQSKDSGKAPRSKVLEISFGNANIEKREQAFPGKNWVRNIEDLFTMRNKLNTSWVQGPEKNNYLEDVKLQMLDKLKLNMTQSRVPSSEGLHTIDQ